jgi:hypothetical protein
MKIICISGHAQHGKDTFAGMLSDVYKERGERVLITHYADLLKYVCKAFWGWNGKKDATGRTLLQKVGTDVFRKNDPDFWVRFMVEVLGFAAENWDRVIIPDCRFPNEIDELKKEGFDVHHIRIVRIGFMSPLSEEQQNHPSETALDDVTPDFTVYNHKTLSDLYGSAITIASEI